MDTIRKKTAEITCDILKCIPEDGIPNGHLYAHLCGAMNIDQYQGIIGTLKNVSAITESGHYLSRGRNYRAAITGLERMTNGTAKN